MSTFNAFSCNRAEDIVMQFTVTGSGSISGWTLDFWLYYDEGYTEQLLQLTPVITDALNRVIQVSMTSAQTTQPTATYYYVLARTDSGNHATLANGTLYIGPCTAT